MGRAFRVVKRMAHLTVEVGERRPKAGAPAGRPRRAAKTPAKAKAKTEGE
jgi:hypothetical protein